MLRAVEHLSRGEVAEGVALLEQQGRVTEIADPEKRIASIARNYADNPTNTIIVSPDNASRRAINQAVRSELQERGIVESENHALRVLAPRSDMTGSDRAGPRAMKSATCSTTSVAARSVASSSAATREWFRPIRNRIC